MPSGSPYTDLDRPPLSEATLRSALIGPDRFVQDIQVATEIGSTNTELRARAREGAPEGTVLVAELQTAGRGRLDRGWNSPPRAGLTFSVLLRPPSTIHSARWPWLPLLTGCVVAEGLRSVADLEPQLKWPNDVLLDDRKVCGILLERVETPDGPAAIVGIGLNVTTMPAELPSHDATSLRLASAATTDRGLVLVALLRTLEALYTAWCRIGGDTDAGAGGGIRAAYKRRCATLGRHVRIELEPGRWIDGTAEDVDTDGRLVVRTAAGVQVVGAGDVRHVR